MKKIIGGSLVAVMLAFVLNLAFSFADCGHNHADAAGGSVNWQCRVCGQRAWLRQGTLPASYGCGFDISKRHIWERLD